MTHAASCALFKLFLDLWPACGFIFNCCLYILTIVTITMTITSPKTITLLPPPLLLSCMLHDYIRNSITPESLKQAKLPYCQNCSGKVRGCCVWFWGLGIALLWFGLNECWLEICRWSIRNADAEQCAVPRNVFLLFISSEKVFTQRYYAILVAAQVVVSAWR